MYHMHDIVMLEAFEGVEIINVYIYIYAMHYELIVMLWPSISVLMQQLCLLSCLLFRKGMMG